MGILEETLIPRFTPPEDAFMWGTVTQASPLRIKLDGETAALTVTPVDLVGNLALNDRVWVQLHGHRLVVVGKPVGTAGLPLAKGVVAGGTTTSGTYTSSGTTRAQVVAASSFTAVSGRLYKITAHTQLYNSTASTAGVTIRESTTELRGAGGFVMGSIDLPCDLVHYWSPSAGSHTLNYAFWRQSGSGTITAYVSTGESSYIYVEDVGLALA